LPNFIYIGIHTHTHTHTHMYIDLAAPLVQCKVPAVAKPLVIERRSCNVTRLA
jgi:hypothetical protein